VGIPMDPVPSFKLVILFSSARIEGALERCLRFPQVLPDLGNEGVQVLNILFRRRAGVDGSFLCLSQPRHSLNTNELEPPWAHKSKGGFPSARMDLRIVRSRQKRQMAVPLGLVLRHIAAELSNEDAVLPLHLPVRLRVIERGIVRS